MKGTFLKNEFWMLSIQGAFQRANVYEKDEFVDEAIRDAFRKGLREFIDQNLIKSYEIGVTEDQHFANIKKLKEHAEFIGVNILQDNIFHYGVAQKLLNLYLKYLWVADYIAEPVHFPVDARIQESLNMGTEAFPWTKMTTEKEYMKVINKAKAILSGKYPTWKGSLSTEIKSLAELELYLFSVESTY